MCLILIAWQGHAAYPCVLAANRDEDHARASSTARWWPDHPQILAGRDLLGGGTWLGMTRTGRFAALTNFRGPQPKRSSAPSRGLLVSGFLQSTATVPEELSRLYRVGAQYNGFNLIFSDGARLGIYESMSGNGRLLGPGVYGLSNHLLDTPWPKVQKAKSRLSAQLGGQTTPEGVLELLRDAVPAPDEVLPTTGLSLEWERLVSSAFILAPDYGTRCSTVIRVDRDFRASFDEWSWDHAGRETDRISVSFEVAKEVRGD